MILRNQDAVSPVIGVILMVAVTVILASVIAVFGFGFGSTMNSKGPTSSIVLSNVPETLGIVDMKIVHKAGDTLRSGDWKISIVQVGQSPVFQTSSTDFNPGDQIITTNLTSGSGTYTVTNASISTTGVPGSLLSDTKYEVKIVVYPYGTMVVDAVVSVR